MSNESSLTNSIALPETFTFDGWRVANEIQDRLRENFWEAANKLVEESVLHLRNCFPAQLDAADAKRMLDALRKKRRFSSLGDLAEACIMAGIDAPRIRRHLAQSLIETGKYGAAKFVLEPLCQPPIPPGEQDEAWGLIGRLHKQWYVNPGAGVAAGGVAHLLKAIDAYRKPWDSNPDDNYWHGINVCALLARAQRERPDLKQFASSSEVAGRVLEIIDGAEARATRPLPAYALATRVEAHIALAQFDKALRWLGVYVRADDADAFEFASTLRQLAEVWQLDTNPSGGALLLPILHAALLGKEGGRLTVSGTKELGKVKESLELPNLESVIGDGVFKSLRWLETGIGRCQSIARIETTAGEKLGTGWLVRGSAFNQSWGDQLLLLTNKHVISPLRNGSRFPVPGHQPAALPGECVASFERLSGRFEIDTEAVWSSADVSIDATFVKVRGLPAGAEPLVLDPAEAGATQQPGRVYVIGHPAGLDLAFSMENNFVVDCDERRLRYRSPTEGGSSGSPVFDERYWNVIALHHAGGSLANEGILVSAIRKAIPS